MNTPRIGVVVAALSGLLTAVASGQSMNLDVGSGSGGPPATFAGAGSGGVWNVLTEVGNQPSADISGTTAGDINIPEKSTPAMSVRPREGRSVAGGVLVDLDGNPTSVRFSSLGSPAPISIDDVGTSGDFASLFDDFVPGIGDVVLQYELTGVAEGEYDVIVYSWFPGSPTMNSLIFVDTATDASHAVTTGGSWPGGLVEGVTHSTHRVTVTDGRIVIDMVGGMWTTSGALNGLQLVKIEPDDGSFVPVTDINGDGATTAADLVLFVELWVAGHGCDGILPGVWCIDINRDGSVTRDDYRIIFDHVDWDFDHVD